MASGSELIKLERQIVGKMQHKADVVELKGLVVDTLRVIRGLAAEFRKTVDDVNADFEVLKARVDKLEGKDA